MLLKKNRKFSTFILIALIVFVLLENKYHYTDKIKDEIGKKEREVSQQLFHIILPERGKVILSECELPKDGYANILIGIELNSRDYGEIYNQLVDEYGEGYEEAEDEYFYWLLNERDIEYENVEIAFYDGDGLRREVDKEFAENNYVEALGYEVYVTERYSGTFQIWLWSVAC